MDSSRHTYMIEMTRCVEINENDKTNTLAYAMDGCTGIGPKREVLWEKAKI